MASRTDGVETRASAKARWERPRLRRDFQHDDRLVSTRNDRLGDRDQMALLVEDAEAGRLPIAGIELRGSALRCCHAAGLDLRKGQIEFRAVADAFLDDRQHGGTR